MSRISLVQLAGSVRKFNLNRPFICPILPNLHIVELVHETGAIFSGPGQVLQIREFKQASDEELAKIRATLDDWREQDRLPFPDHSADEKQKFKGQLDYPTPGSSR